MHTNENAKHTNYGLHVNFWNFNAILFYNEKKIIWIKNLSPHVPIKEEIIISVISVLIHGMVWIMTKMFSMIALLSY